MSFYLGSYQILADSLEPKTDSGPWALPDEPTQHLADTSNVEELFINVEDMDVLPQNIQFGAATWTDDEGFTPDDTFVEFYIKDEAFYLRSFNPVNWFTEFYIADEAFYVRGFTPTDLYSEFYVRDEAFYVRGFSPNDTWTEFYVVDGFYVRSFTPTDSWTEFYVR